MHSTLDFSLLQCVSKCFGVGETHLLVSLPRLKRCSRSEDGEEDPSPLLSNLMKQFLLLRTDVRRLLWSCLSAGERVKETISALQLTNTASVSLMVVEPPAGLTDDQQQAQHRDLIIFSRWRRGGEEEGGWELGGVGWCGCGIHKHTQTIFSTLTTVQKKIWI